MSEFISSPEEYKEKVKILKALAHPIRLCIVRGLIGDEGCNVSKMCECLDIPQSTLSQHLAKLRNAGILESTRHGREVIYNVNNQITEKIIAVLFD